MKPSAPALTLLLSLGNTLALPPGIVAKSQSASARKAADEVLASLKMLRRESERNSPMPR